MDKKSLINLAKDISKEHESEKYFEFASNYLMNDREKGIKTTDNFFKMLNTCTQKTNFDTVKNAFGVRGKKNNNIKDWIDKMLKNPKLRRLSLDELHYVMAVASRCAKIYDVEYPK